MVLVIGLLVGCGTSKNLSNSQGVDTETETREETNSITLSLIERIRRLPGVAIRGGVPIFISAQSDRSGTLVREPLYVLDGYILGNSFQEVQTLIRSIDVEKIEGLTGPETSIYGIRGGAGVILLTSYK